MLGGRRAFFFNHHPNQTAIYVGEHPGAHKVLHSVKVHITPTLLNAERRPEWLQKNIERLREHLYQYRKAHLETVRASQFVAHGLPLEAAAIATALGSCVLDEPELLNGLVLLLKGQNSEDRYRTLDTTEAIVLEAALALSRADRESVYVSEVAVEANRLLELRGEQMRLSPEKVGHRLRNWVCLLAVSAKPATVLFSTRLRSPPFTSLPPCILRRIFSRTTKTSPPLNLQKTNSLRRLCRLCRFLAGFGRREPLFSLFMKKARFQVFFFTSDLWGLNFRLMGVRLQPYA